MPVSEKVTKNRVGGIVLSQTPLFAFPQDKDVSPALLLPVSQGLEWLSHGSEQSRNAHTDARLVWELCPYEVDD